MVMLQQTQMRLQKLQVEYQQLCSQCTLLSNKATEYQNILVALQEQIRLNPADTSLKARYSNITQQLRSISQTISRNNAKLGTLQRQISVENTRLASQQQKAMMSMYRKQNRNLYPKY